MFIIILLTLITGLISTDSFIPSLPYIMNEFHQTQAHTQLTMTLFLLGYAISQLIYGPISDVVGRKKPLIAGSLVFIAGTLICLFSHTFLMFCLGRAYEGVGAAAGISLGRILIRDYYDEKLFSVKLSQFSIFILLTPAIAPFFGGFLQNFFGYKANFVFYLVYGMVVLLLQFFLLKETISKKIPIQQFNIIKQYNDIFQYRKFIFYAMISGLTFASMILYINTMPFIIKNTLHYSSLVSGFIMLFSAFGMMAGSFLNIRLSKQYSAILTITISGYILLFSGFLMMLLYVLFGTTLLGLSLPLFLITLSCGLLLPNSSALAIGQLKSNFGAAGSIFGFIQISVGMMMNVILNSIHQQGLYLIGFIYFVISILILMLIFVVKGEMSFLKHRTFKRSCHS